jgi:exonuclease III
MTIITWNCNMAFRKKAAAILPFQPDILIVPECEHPDKLIFPAGVAKPTDILWFGKNQHKGLGIFSYSDFRFSVHDNHNPALQLIVPIAATNGRMNLNLLAIWANNPTDPDGQYVEQVWKALQHYDSLLRDTNTILAGDFNSNTIWDKKRRESNHSNVVKRLEEKGIFSAYHLFHQQIQGQEAHPTLYLYRHQTRPYHIDYCFVSADLAPKIQSVIIGDYDFWMRYSDHVPVIVRINS